MNDASVALFDLDGTITRRDTYLAYLLGFLARHPERWPRAALLPLAVLCHIAGWRGNTWLKTTFLRAVLGGVPRSRLESWTESFLDRVLSRGLSAGALETIERHRAAGHALVLVTASLDFYAEPLGRRLGFDTILCTRARYDAAGRVTGELDGGNCYGPNKLKRVEADLRTCAAELPVTLYTIIMPICPSCATCKNRAQHLRTLAVLLAWPAVVGLGMLFVAWWKAVALVVGAFLLLVPVLGALTPRAMSAHYVRAIGADLERRLARGGADATQLRLVLEHLDRLSGPPPA